MTGKESAFPDADGSTAELLAKYDRPGPRYTSYPTAVDFHEDFGADEYADCLVEAAVRSHDPLSLYVHLPFCENRCSFCACHVVVTRNESLASTYLDRLIAEARTTVEKLGDRRTLQQYHWGGGTPTFHSPEALVDLHGQLLSVFELESGAEVAIEVDPRITTEEHLATLRTLGFNRLSMGVQDVDEVVQDLIGRHQTWEQTADLHDAARGLGYESINVDLIYGLPGQNEYTFTRSLEQVIGLRPDRLAVYSFALVPWMRPHQKRVDIRLLPDRDVKFGLLSLAIDRLTAAGYEQIGMDHFALRGDELAVAHRERTLSRNFMGYTTKRGTEIVGLGTSAISDIGDSYAQSHRRMASYITAVDAGEFPTERGIVLTGDDRIRRHVITELMCNGRLLAHEVDDRFEIVVEEYFADELDELHAPGGLVEAGFVVTDGRDIEATPLGRMFIRNVAMVFDVRLRTRATEDQMFSRTV
ncbi:MAG: oxygen-independent coproporphyrinogen III oxidase [Acidimicrobiales bacterium]|nr:oxygen-independent coproporphyrinogen III oxidase [Acidimicrobiales bacterium]HJO80735.1 oxygen-independent coproporphyrinogen III oxidase [Acidimicrobiales bacterium]